MSNILIFPCAIEVSELFADAVESIGNTIIRAHSERRKCGDGIYYLPPVFDKSFDEKFRKLLLEKSIDYVYSPLDNIRDRMLIIKEENRGTLKYSVCSVDGKYIIKARPKGNYGRLQSKAMVYTMNDLIAGQMVQECDGFCVDMSGFDYAEEGFIKVARTHGEVMKLATRLANSGYVTEGGDGKVAYFYTLKNPGLIGITIMKILN